MFIYGWWQFLSSQWFVVTTHSNVYVVTYFTEMWVSFNGTLRGFSTTFRNCFNLECNRIMLPWILMLRNCVQHVFRSEIGDTIILQWFEWLKIKSHHNYCVGTFSLVMHVGVLAFLSSPLKPIPFVPSLAVKSRFSIRFQIFAWQSTSFPNCQHKSPQNSFSSARALP